MADKPKTHIIKLYSPDGKTETHCVSNFVIKANFTSVLWFTEDGVDYCTSLPYLVIKDAKKPTPKVTAL